MAEKTYYFSRSFGDIADSGNEIAIIAVHFKNAYLSSDGDAASVDGVFQLSDQPMRIKTNERYLNMTVTNIDEDSIEMENSDRQITLNSDKDIPLMMGIHIRTADQEADDPSPLRFNIYKEINEPGTYEVRGKVAEAFDGESINWNARDFPGFFYDLDEDLGRKRYSSLQALQMIVTVPNQEHWFINPVLKKRNLKRISGADITPWDSWVRIILQDMLKITRTLLKIPCSGPLLKRGIL